MIDAVARSSAFPTLGPNQVELLLLGLLAGGVGVALSLLAPRGRRWWPATAAAVSFVGARWDRVAPRLPDESSLLLAALVGAALLGGLTWAEAEIARSSRRPAWFVPVLLAATAGGVYGAVPDTEAPLWVLGTSAILVLVSALPVPSPAAATWAAPAVLVVWAAAVGAIGRPASFVGVAACAGVLAAEPAAQRVFALAPPHRGTVPTSPVAWPIILVLHVGAVAIGSRVWGLGSSTATAASGAAVTLALLAACVLLAMVATDRARRT